MTTERKDYLGITTSYRENLNWRIHWLYCDLTNLEDQIISGRSTHEEYMRELEKITEDKFSKILWETCTMIGHDNSPSELAYRSLVAYVNYSDKLVDVCILLERKFMQTHTNELLQFKEKIANARRN